MPDSDGPFTTGPFPSVADPAAGVAGLLARLTTAEKIAFLHQHQPAVERLGLAAFHTGCEVLHGVAWIGRATVFPQAVGLGATWDRALLRRIGQAVSTEVRAFRQDPRAVKGSDVYEKHTMVSLNVWAPVVNLLRDPRWGRNEEGYSEDPYATAQLATAYCRGLRGDHPAIWRTAPVLKHFLAYNVETDRAAIDVKVPARVLHEYELPAFRGPVEAGVVAGVMPGYNLTNGIPNHVHPLINDVLRAWNPRLVVCSDAQAPSNLVEIEKYFPSHVESHAAALKAGLDSYTDNDADSLPTIERFTAALERGLITQADIDAAVGRVLAMRARTGEFDPGNDPYAGIGADVVACEAHAALALEAAKSSIVLLKNAGRALPLAPSTGSVAVIGHLGTRVMTDWYSGTLPYAVSIADGLRTRCGAEAVTAVDGADVVRLRCGSREFGRFRHHDWGTSVQCPVPVHTFQSVENGRYLTLTGEGDRAVTAAAATPDGWFVKELWELHPAGEAADDRVLLRSNAEHSRKFVRVDENGDLVADAESAAQAARFSLDPLASGVHEAVAAAGAARRAIVVVGNDPHINGRETIDRDGLSLPRQQETLLRAVCEANPDTVVVVVSSYPYAMDWAAEHVPAILWTSHGGQELGNAVAEVLVGEHNPAGRLPQTWYAADAVLPDPGDYDVIGSQWTYQYSQRPQLFAFGHGLSYTSFAYSNLVATVAHVAHDAHDAHDGSTAEPGIGAAPESNPVDDSDGPCESYTVTVEVTVTNTGALAGEEVAQLYSRALDAEMPTPLRKLQGFERIRLEPGESRTVRFEVPGIRLAHWCEREGCFVGEPGDHEFAAGGSSASLAARVTVPCGEAVRRYR
ncbi:glycoside hydrolase family 3 C-terminal domain-containing protein [Actinocrinis puniceicyclus]|uniref:Glycoside hydrolase family 3 C-terminal domain-containing protein n=1 Tax=Actinocrinis puniceicyclus TaxID=977794 RepID=A0A8J7WPI6_9ACTN|nr:glycoside hydrolase family 3 C-terminal domain-containing protein [Actinocrinis puniceicyclus]